VDLPKLLHEADLALTGTLLKNEVDIRLTFRVDRIWKGPNHSRDIVVYVLGPLSVVSGARFEEGKKYFIAASVMSPVDRELNGVGPDEALAFGFIGRPCRNPILGTKTLIKQLDTIVTSRKPPG
jgi:hypothetical protein